MNHKHVKVIIILFSLICILSFITAYYKLSRPQSSTPLPNIPSPSPSPTPTQISINIRPIIPTDNSTVSFTLSAPLPGYLPEKVTLYQRAPLNHSRITSQLSQELGFSANPFVSTESGMLTYEWYEPDPNPRYLSYQSQPGNIWFFDDHIPSSPAPSISESNQTLDSIVMKMLTNSDISISVIDTSFQKDFSNHQTQVYDQNEANITQIQSRYILNNLPLFLSPYNQYNLVARISSQGIRHLTMELTPQLIPKSETFLINPQQAAQVLVSGDGILVYLNNPSQFEREPNSDFNNVDITSAELAYYTINSSEIGPVYRFSGRATTDGSNNYQEVVYIVPAY